MPVSTWSQNPLLNDRVAQGNSPSYLMGKISGVHRILNFLRLLVLVTLPSRGTGRFALKTAGGASNCSLATPKADPQRPQLFPGKTSAGFSLPQTSWARLPLTPLLQPMVTASLRGQRWCFRPLRFLQPKWNVFLRAIFYIWKKWLLWLLNALMMFWHLAIPISCLADIVDCTLLLWHYSLILLMNRVFFVVNQAVNHTGNWFYNPDFKDSSGRRLHY